MSQNYYASMSNDAALSKLAARRRDTCARCMLSNRLCQCTMLGWPGNTREKASRLHEGTAAEPHRCRHCGTVPDDQWQVCPELTAKPVRPATPREQRQQAAKTFVFDGFDD